MRVRNEHWGYFLDFAEIHPAILTNTFSSSNSKVKLNNLWQEVTAGLNGLGYGEKTVMEWRKAIIDWKSKTKSKASQIKSHCSKTGGGPPFNKLLGDLEERLIKIIGKKIIHGDETTKELGFPIKEDSLSTSYKKMEDGMEKEPITVEVNDNINVLSDYFINHDHGKYCDKEKQSERTYNSRKVKKHVQEKLIGMSRDTIDILHSMNNNLSSMASSLEEISKTMQDLKQLYSLTAK